MGKFDELWGGVWKPVGKTRVGLVTHYCEDEGTCKCRIVETLMGVAKHLQHSG